MIETLTAASVRPYPCQSAPLVPRARLRTRRRATKPCSVLPPRIPDRGDVATMLVARRLGHSLDEWASA
jgi:hypothetical protein